MNATTIGSGVVAAVTLTLAKSGILSVPISVSNALGVAPNGGFMPFAGSAGAISILAAVPNVSGLSCAPSSIASGGTSTCTVTLTAAAPSGGATVTLSDNNASLATPASVAVASGATSAAFTVTGGLVTSNQSVAVTASLNGTSATATVTVNGSSGSVPSPGGCPCTIWSPASTPATPDSGDPNGVELGLRFRSDTNGFITGVRFYKSAGNTGSHVGNLWSNTGALLATATFTGESNSGWQQVNFSSPVAIAANTTYVVSYYTPTGHYSFDRSYFSSRGVDAPPLHALADGTDGGDGTYAYGASSAFPNATFSSANYWVDPVFTTSTSTSNGCPCTVWSPTTTPATPDSGDASGGVELGVRFRSDINGFITGVRFYKSAANTGTHVGNLWSNTGALLATATFTGESGSGWQQVNFSSPIAIVANTTYVASYFAPGGHYSFTTNYFAKAADNAPLHALSNSAAGGNGLFVYKLSSAFPNSTFNSGNYWVDVVFNATAARVTTKVIPGGAAPLAPPLHSRQPVTNTAEELAGSSQRQNALSTLACSPGTASAGAPVSCELSVTASSTPLQLQIESSSGQVKVPVAVTTRANQTKLTFQASVESAARQQSAVIAAMLGDRRAESTIRVMPSAGPVLTAPNRQTAKFGSPISFRVNAADPAGLAVQLAAAGMPDGASFNPATGRFEWTPNASQAGKRDVTFTAVDAAAQSSSVLVSIEVDAGTPVLNPSNEFACSPNAIASLSGRWLATSAAGVSDPTGASTELGGSKVTVNGQSVPVLFSSQSRVDFLCPAFDPGTPLSVIVESNGSASAPLITSIRELSPTILSLEGTEQKQGLISFSDTTDLAMTRNYHVPAHPAQPGDELLIWTTGLGVTPEASTTAAVVELGGISTEIESVSAVPGRVGLYAIQVRVPEASSTGDAVPVQIHAAGSDGRRFDSNVVTAALEAARQ